jgi:site-specific recombinase XerD
MNRIEQFQNYLERSGCARNTVRAYVFAVRSFLERYGEVDGKNLAAYRIALAARYKPKTVNLRLNAMNKYLAFIHRRDLRQKGVKVQQKACLENVISDADYRLLKRRLKEDGEPMWYFLVWIMAATGVRVSELLQLRAEHVLSGHADLYGKGGKLRRIYFPENLRWEAASWLGETGLSEGYLFRNRFGEVISPRGVAMRLQDFARRYGIDPKEVHPHSFRHRFAKNFLDRVGDLAFLADILGHDSIETTRIYLRRTSAEQRELLDRVVTW